MKHYGDNFNKKSRLYKLPELPESRGSAIIVQDYATIKERLSGLLQVQNDYFPCFDWTFPPPLLSKQSAPSSVAELFSQPSITPGRFSIYLHSPFCKTLCSFCYYTVIPGHGISESENYVDYLLREMAMYREAMQGSVCESIYFGGGTPTFLDDSLLTKLFDGLHSTFDIDPQAEISIEAAPGTLPLSKVKLLKQLGVNRLSYGIQTLDEVLLASMNRHYSVTEAVQELEGAIDIIGNVNVDTMYGFDGEPEHALLDTLSTFYRLGVPSMSIYSLDKQRSQAKSVFEPPKDEHYENKIRQYHHAKLFLEERGYAQVLQNVFAIPAKSSYKHQVRRWDNLTLLSLGVAAQGYAPKTPYQNASSLKSYYRCIDEGRPPIVSMERLSPDMELCRELTSKLRFTQVDTAEMQAKYGVDVRAVFRHLIGALSELDYLEEEGSVIRLSKKAAYYNNIIPMLFAPDHFKEQLMGLPQEYIETFPVPYIVTQLGKVQSAPFFGGTAEVIGMTERRQRLERRSLSCVPAQDRRRSIDRRNQQVAG
jgi:oxygen-independent coproporphyrinogen-3 oxidase